MSDLPDLPLLAAGVEMLSPEEPSHSSSPHELSQPKNREKHERAPLVPSITLRVIQAATPRSS